MIQPKLANRKQNYFLTLLPIPNVTMKHFGELLLQKVACKREILSFPNNNTCKTMRRLSQVCLLPSPSEPAAAWAIKGSKSGCRVTPPAVRQPLHVRQHFPAAIKPMSAAPRAQLLDLGIGPLPGRAIHGLHGY